MRPANTHQAQQHMRQLLGAKISGKRSTRVKEQTRRADNIAVTLYQRFQVGPYQYQLKHIEWYLNIHIQSLTPATQYRHWLTIRLIVTLLGHGSNWRQQLSGTWITPLGSNPK